MDGTRNLSFLGDTLYYQNQIVWKSNNKVLYIYIDTHIVQSSACVSYKIEWFIQMNLSRAFIKFA